MGYSKFDEFTKALATSTSRRHALKAIGVTVGGILGLGGVGTALAKCAGIGDSCSQSSQCCIGYCNPSTFTCACPSGTVPCGGTCVSNVCPDGQVFNPSTCTCACPTGLTECGGTCTNTSSDPNNCGSCGNHCPSTASCVNGQCCPNSQVCINSTGTVTCCPAGTTCLSNGTCAHPCTTTTATCPRGCRACIEDADALHHYCSSGTGTGACTSDINCPQGQFCEFGLRGGRCVVAC